jgi:hypothetical protein
MCWPLLLCAASCSVERVEREPVTPAFEGLYRADRALADGAPYQYVMFLVDEARELPGADREAYGIAGTRFAATLVYERPVHEVEAALVERLAVDPNPETRSYAAAAAYVTYPELRHYFDDVVAELEALPRTPLIERVLAFTERAYANAARQQQLREQEPERQRQRLEARREELDGRRQTWLQNAASRARDRERRGDR